MFIQCACVFLSIRVQKSRFKNISKYEFLILLSPKKKRERKITTRQTTLPRLSLEIIQFLKNYLSRKKEINEEVNYYDMKKCNLLYIASIIIITLFYEDR